MVRRLILDTTALIAIERERVDFSAFDEDDTSIAAITVAEFREGIELAQTEKQRAKRTDVLDAILQSVAVLDYTERTAAAHAPLLAFTRRTGTPRGAHDLIIAATAVETGRTIVSLDTKARFGDLPDVSAISLS
ncbi:MAG: PIN domain-containing protein [Microbacterium sp.]